MIFVLYIQYLHVTSPSEVLLGEVRNKRLELELEQFLERVIAVDVVEFHLVQEFYKLPQAERHQENRVYIRIGAFIRSVW